MAEPLEQALHVLAENLRHHRTHKGWTQEDLARHSGISRRKIIEIENAQNNVSLSTLDHLANALGLSFVELVSPRLASSTGKVQTGDTLWSGNTSHSKGVLINAIPTRHHTELWHWHLAPGEHYPALPDPEGMHELLYVLQGTLTLELQDQTLHLQAGESLTFPSSQPYTYRNNGSTKLEFIRNVTH